MTLAGQWFPVAQQVSLSGGTIELLMEESGIGRAQTIMVGDSAVDVMTARNAQVRACGVSWGFQPETFAEAPPDFVIDDMSELVGLLAPDF